MSDDGSDDGWEYSTEGDLDPDLTEEAGYAYWDPPRRPWWPTLMRVGLAVTLALFVAGILLTRI